MVIRIISSSDHLPRFAHALVARRSPGVWGWLFLWLSAVCSWLALEEPQPLKRLEVSR